MIYTQIIINNWFTQNRINTRYILNDLQNLYYDSVSNLSNFFILQDKNTMNDSDLSTIILTNNCNVYFNSIDNVWEESANLNEYFTNCFETCFPNKIINNLKIDNSTSIKDKNEDITHLHLTLHFDDDTKSFDNEPIASPEFKPPSPTFYGNLDESSKLSLENKTDTKSNKENDTNKVSTKTKSNDEK